jgi:hypothetical protein
MKSDRTYFKYGKDKKGPENLSDIGLASGIATSLIRAVPQQHNNHSHWKIISNGCVHILHRKVRPSTR